MGEPRGAVWVRNGVGIRFVMAKKRKPKTRRQAEKLLSEMSLDRHVSSKTFIVLRPCGPALVRILFPS